MDAAANVQDVLTEARGALKELPVGMEQGGEGQGRFTWIVSQLNNLEATLEALLSDVEAGCSLSEMGYFGDEFEELLADISGQISNLKGLIRSMKTIGIG